MNTKPSQANPIEHVDGHTESFGSILVDCDAPEDTTVRPALLDPRRFWPKDLPFPPPAEGNNEPPPAGDAGH
jgi:hypothetical protein